MRKLKRIILFPYFIYTTIQKSRIEKKLDKLRRERKQFTAEYNQLKANYNELQKRL